MLDAAFEGLVSHLTAADGGADLEQARLAWFERTGEVQPGEPWYEERIQAFLDWYLCDWRSADGSRPLDRALAEADSGEDERAAALGARTAARSLYRVLEVGDRVRVADALGGGRFRLGREGPAARLRLDDVFDGRLVVVCDTLRLAPGIIFHPPESHAPLSEMLPQIDLDEVDRAEVLDGLLRMRMRLDRFTSIRAKHVYRLEALWDREILSAGWAQRSQRVTS